MDISDNMKIDNNNKYKTVLVVLITITMLMIASAVPSISRNVDKLAVSASTAIQTRVPQKQAFAVNKNPSITIAGREATPMDGVINPVESSHAALLAATPVFPGYHPAVASDSLGNVVLGFESIGEPNVYFTASIDGGRTWADNVISWDIPPELPDIDSCGDGRFIGGMVPNYLQSYGGELYKVVVTDPGDISPSGYRCLYWNWYELPDPDIHYYDFKSIAVGGYIAEDLDENTWAFGGHSIVGTYEDEGTGTLLEDIPLFSYQFNSAGRAWIYTFSDEIAGSEITSHDIDPETLYSYAVWNYDNDGTMDIFFYIIDFGEWDLYQGYPIHPDIGGGTINTVGNDRYVDISTNNDNVIIVSRRDGDIVAYYSTDGMTTVMEASIETDAVNPRIVHTGDSKATCIFVKGESLGSVYYSTTEDGGATWSTPEQIDEPENAYVPEEYKAADVCGFGAAWMNEDDGNIYFGRIGNAPPEFSNENPSDGETKVPITLSELNVTIVDLEGDSFNWSIETSPDIGSSSDTGEGNGTKICNISGLEYNTTYTWYVNATDTGSGQTASENYTFTTEEELQNNPPNQPSNPSPSHEAKNVSLDPTIGVYVTDPDGDNMTVIFYQDLNSGITPADKEIGRVNDTTSGTRVNITWEGLDYNSTYNWYAIANDSEYENRSDTWSFTTVEETPNTPPVANFTYKKYGLKVEFNGSISSDPDGFIENYTWDFDDGNYSYIANPQHIFAANGSYNVNLTVRDSNDTTDSYNQTIDVTNARPVVGFTAESDGKTVTFTSTSYDIDGNLTNFTWYFGDDNISYDGNPVHTYAAENHQYTVTLKVTDNLGLSNSTTEIIKTEDTTDPTVTIVKPKRSVVYINNEEKFGRLLGMAIIIGDITIEVNATDEGSGIAKVEFYGGLLGTKLLGNDTEAPYTFEWTRDRIRFFHIQTLKVVAYDNEGNSDYDRMIVRKLL